MTVRIHPAEKEKDYTDLLLALLAQASVPALAETLSQEKHTEKQHACPA